MANPGQDELFAHPTFADGSRHINGRCVLQLQRDRRIVIVSGVILAHYAAADRMSEAHAMVSLIEHGHADQNDVARAFGCSTRTVRRCQRRFEDGGLPALTRVIGYPKGQPRLPSARARLVSRLKAEGSSNCAIARRLGIDEKAVRKLLKRLGWVKQAPADPLLPLAGGSDPNLSAFPTTLVGGIPPAPSPASDPNLSASSAALPASLDRDPANRVMDRLGARLGLLDDAAPLFRCGSRVPRAGVLLAVPALVQTGVFDCGQAVFGSIGPAFYGLRTTLLALLLMALLRIKRPEALKEHAPPDLGRLLGLDRAPEVKTMRRKLSALAAFGRAARFGRELARLRVAARADALAFLYVDGHVRVYHGDRAIPKAHVARMRLAMPATSDYWVNDEDGEPLFVVTAEANAPMTRMLPPLLAEIRDLVGKRRVTVVFDRGGWSPKLFQTIIASGFDILTYRKGRSRRVPRARFRTHAAVIDGRKVAYTLADQGIALLGRRLRLRQVTRLCDDDRHQTPIITSRRDLPAVVVAYRMFERWRQENFFKYLREEYALDALADHQAEPADPARTVPNPAFFRLGLKLSQARADLQRLSADYGLGALANAEARRPTMRGFKIAASKAGRAVATAQGRVAALERRRACLPRRVPVAEVVNGEVVRLSTERKHLTNCLKMVAYQAEGELVRIVARHYRRAEDEGRTLVQSALASAADIAVTADELRVTLAPLSSRHRSRAVEALCEELNAARVCFPGTRLRLRYGVARPF